ncbi:MAG TPA: hypothetical protein VE869_07970 [Gemmatimonas sp.]|nr:hypothetical protein [Gemmatimonas sp.]
MKQQKSLAMMFLLGALLTGGALGFSAGRVWTKRPYSREFDRSSMREEFARAVQLKPQQRLVVDSIFNWRDSLQKQVWKRYEPARDSIVDSARVLINQQLDTTQQRLFKELRDSMVARENLRRTRGAKR